VKKGKKRKKKKGILDLLSFFIKRRNFIAKRSKKKTALLDLLTSEATTRAVLAGAGALANGP
jgi:hypothetical protein